MSRIVATGKLKGIAPERGDVIYMRDTGVCIPVLVTSVEAPDGKITDGADITLVIFGVGKYGITTHTVFSNIRPVEIRKDIRNMLQEAVSFPVVVKRSSNYYLHAAFTVLAGVSFVLLYFAARKNVSDASLAFIPAVALITLGLLMFIECMVYKITFTADKQVKIRTVFVHRTCGLNDLQHRLADKNAFREKMVLRLYDSNKILLAEIAEDCTCFYAACRITVEEEFRKQRDILDKRLNSTEFFVPVRLTSSDGKERTDFLIKDVNGKKVLNIYFESEHAADESLSDDSTRPYAAFYLEHLIKRITATGSADSVIVHGDGLFLPETIEINVKHSVKANNS